MGLCCSSGFGTEQILIQRLHANLSNNLAHHYKWNKRFTLRGVRFLQSSNTTTFLLALALVELAYASVARSSSHVFVGSVFTRCPISCLYVFNSVLWCPLRFPCKNAGRFVCTPFYFIRDSCFVMSFLLYLYILVCSTISISDEVCVVS